jgi:LAO/AO transport system kinase
MPPPASSTNSNGDLAKPDLDAYEQGVLAGDRAALGRAITLVESTRADHQDLAQELLTRLLPKAGRAQRVGITGVPGVGKSTFIDGLGSFLTESGHRVAVLAVDPSSTRSGGSILGDKTRMDKLSVDPNAFIRPSPTAGTLGGVTRSTRETMIVVEAAGYDVVLVETVGVGQSEIAVANMVDTFLVLALARTGDSLQGIKRGVLELADLVAVNKADGPHVRDAESAASELRDALRLVTPTEAEWKPPVLTCSGLEGTNLDQVWETVVRHRDMLEANGELAAKHQRQQVDWMWSMVFDTLVTRFKADPKVRGQVPELEAAVRDGTMTPTAAARRLLGG